MQFYDTSSVYCIVSQSIFHHHTLDSLYPLLRSTPFPLVTTISLSASVSFCLFFSFICCFQVYILHMSGAGYSQIPSMFSQMAVLCLFLWLSSIPLCMCQIGKLHMREWTQTTICLHIQKLTQNNQRPKLRSETINY